MHQVHRICLLFSLAIAFCFQAKADSPLTSTPFADAYADVSIVKYASGKGKVDKKIAKFLMDEKNAIDEKAAVVNALGWDIDGKQNAGIFMNFLKKKYKKNESSDILHVANGSELMCLGYMTAMDDYFNPAPGEKILALAAKKMPDSYTVQMIYSLARAQVHFDTNWCQVWKVVNAVDEDSNLTMELRSEARTIIMDYISLYKSEC